MTTRTHLTSLLAEPLVLDAVVSGSTSYAGRFNWRRGQTADELVEALARARCLRKALAVALWATGAVTVLRAAGWPAQACRTFRHLLYCEGVIEPPRRPTSDDRCRANAKKWGFA